jgi:hypothetical protein
MGFTLFDPKFGEIKFFFSAGSCADEEDVFVVETDISSDLYNLFIMSEAEGMKVKVSGVSTYGFFCSTCDGCVKEKKIIWRPAKVSQQ